ncbi:trefoil factor 2-like isoform X3 [Bradysia coprophila]|uniref:trefoil factor 2-like isoform X3 n=1 Tax=Bradysia coprophila TaxID=38358 RepID=UPI00187DB807|nr:trefoil factor 2-like isoform X3 [Bradysia coprophila]
MKFFLILLSIHLLATNCESAQSTNPDCDFSNPEQRTDGGFPGITQAQCESLGYCFDTTVPNVPWCIKSAQLVSSSNCDFGDKQNRVEGGYPGVTRKQCVSDGNCFDDSTPGVKWCFKPNVNAGGAEDVNANTVGTEEANVNAVGTEAANEDAAATEEANGTSVGTEEADVNAAVPEESNVNTVWTEEVNVSVNSDPAVPITAGRLGIYLDDLLQRILRGRSELIRANRCRCY